ncbi:MULTISPECIES: 3'-5' exonuclease [Vibrio]|jgi:DNA polymerase-3 subunit epsilon|uniref:DNA-directed DNA polymerase n=2 Tax=Vibrio TaxID=662 RepID=A0A2N7JMY9_VIBSP|nr:MULTISPECIES: 3'-5' exonuclease [Vibrio]OED67380.1 DNA polymerase III subunit epsilon [Vibrio splendidus ZS-139]TVU64493.1 3'-5' exonuclease [Vibrio atlanticus]TVU79054.1 3'-5' exonuclease [Vibrio tasmaniensis]MCF7502436.1 3'-5' exonuclease [Vibrio sp. L3-7]PMM43317.1 DNA polymerase III subunit epsilon [Vibrio splendidus]
MNRLFSSPAVDWPFKFAQKLERSKDERLKQFYGEPLPDPETPLSEVTFLAVDFETTGLNPVKDGIITIGLVPFTLNRIYLRQARHWTLRPKQKLEEESVVIHGITHNDIIDAPDLNEVLEEILGAMAGHIPVVHYRRIERDFLDNALKVRLGEGIEFPVLDTLEIESQIQHKLAGGLWNKLKGKKPASVRLGQSRRRYHLPDYTPHHALVDAIATAELLQAQIAHHYSADMPLKDFWL